MDDLIANELLQDARYKEGKRLLLEALASYKAKITKIAPPNPKLQKAYQAQIERANHLRGSTLYHPYLGSGMGHGLLVELADGSIKYDLISGIGVNFFGHSFEKNVDASIDAALQNTIMQGNLQQNVDALNLMELLVKASKMDHVLLTTSGAMANENALKIIFQKKHPAYRIIAFEGCFMGRSLTLSQITDKPSFREGLPRNLFVDYIPFYDPDDPVGSTEKTIQTLKAHLARYPGEHALFALELVQGERGFYTAPREFFHTICKICKDASLSILVDEVQTFARTFELFAFHDFALDAFADVVTIGKISQVCATLWKKEMNPKPGLLSQTFIGSTSAIRSCHKALEHLLQSNLYGPKGKIHEVHAWFRHKLEELHKEDPKLIQGPFGFGSMIAFTPFDGSRDRVNHFVHELFKNGVIAFVAGSNPTRARFLVPAEIMKIEDVDAIMEIVKTTLHELKK